MNDAERTDVHVIPAKAGIQVAYWSKLGPGLRRGDQSPRGVLAVGAGLHRGDHGPRRLLALAFAASLIAHLVATLWPVQLAAIPEPLPPLAATITELPPPPAPVIAHAKPKHKPRPAPAPPLLTAPPAEASTAAVIATGDPLEPPAVAPAPETVAAPEPTEETLPVAAADQAPARELPPRIDLVYHGFLGTRGFFIGDAVYRLEHAANRYSITTVGEARGLAALFFRGQGRLTSTGTLTRAGLQPNLYTAERTSDNRQEAATFDWETGIVLLNDNKTAALETPTLDPLAVLWQFYFAPPDQDEVQFNIATTRRVYRYSFRRAATEKVALSFGEVEAQVWERASGDGSITAKVWLAPSLHNVMVKLRLSNDRGTVEALLDSIRVDETVAQQ
jgi:hypothetical protein